MTPLECIIRDMIAAEGPITVARYMALALGHPVHGYYRTRDPLGAAGDFTTAPEISQMFGELLGLWAAEVWSSMGRPSRISLVELGPGRGTLMADALRAAARTLPAFPQAIELRLVETSPALREAQGRALRHAELPLTWHDSLAEVPSGPAIVLANEFLDALPIRQFVRSEGGWRERLVGLDGEGRLAFGLSPEPLAGLNAPAQSGDILELAERAGGIVDEVATRLRRDGGAALIIDYGHTRSGVGETLQAIRRHTYADPLLDPGEADLTAHVDFAAIGRTAKRAGAAVHGPVSQGAFLASLGIDARAAQLRRNASAAAAEAVASAHSRLTGRGPGEMGEVFKVIGLSDPALPGLPGLPADTTRRIPSDLEHAC